MDTVQCPLCGAKIGAPKFSGFGGKIHMKNHNKRCSKASMAERAFYRTNRRWPQAQELDKLVPVEGV